MVKKKVGGAQRYKVTPGSSPGSKAVEAKKPGPAPPKHLQRKIAKKIGFLDKVASTSTSLGVKAAGISKGKSAAKAKKGSSQALNSLKNSLSGVLDEVQRDVQRAQDEAKKQHVFGQGVSSSKARSSIQVAETSRLKQVLHHPVFKTNPIAAITNHLNATLPPAPAKPAPGSKKAGGVLSHQERKKLSKQRKKQQSQPGDMDE